MTLDYATRSSPFFFFVMENVASDLEKIPKEILTSILNILDSKEWKLLRQCSKYFYGLLSVRNFIQFHNQLKPRFRLVLRVNDNPPLQLSEFSKEDMEHFLASNFVDQTKLEKVIFEFRPENSAVLNDLFMTF